MGQLYLHPKHPIFKQFKHLACPICQKEIFPINSIVIENLEDGRCLILHERCVIPVDTQLKFNY